MILSKVHRTGTMFTLVALSNFRSRSRSHDRRRSYSRSRSDSR